MPDQTSGPPSGPDLQAPGGVSATPAGPRRHSLEQLAAACDGGLFETVGGGWVRLSAPKARLAEMLGCSPQALSSRIDRLAAAGLADRRGGQLLVNVSGVQERLGSLGAASSPASAEAHRRFAGVFTADPDEPSGYRRGDGSAASLSDLAAAGGFSSRGSAAYHMRRRHRPNRPSGPARRASQTPAAATLRRSPAASSGPVTLAEALVALVADTVAAVRPLLSDDAAATGALDRLAAAAAGVPGASRDETGSRATEPVAQPVAEPVVPHNEMSMRDIYNSSHAHSLLPSRDETGSRATEPVAQPVAEPEPSPPSEHREPARQAELSAALAPLIAEAARRGMAPVNVAVIAEAAGDLPVEAVAAAAATMISEMDRRPIVNLGGLMVKACRSRDPHYFPPPPAPLPSRARLPVFDPSVCAPAESDVSAEENARRLAGLRDAAARSAASRTAGG